MRGLGSFLVSAAPIFYPQAQWQKTINLKLSSLGCRTTMLSNKTRKKSTLINREEQRNSHNMLYVDKDNKNLTRWERENESADIDFPPSCSTDGSFFAKHSPFNFPLSPLSTCSLATLLLFLLSKILKNREDFLMADEMASNTQHKSVGENGASWPSSSWRRLLALKLAFNFRVDWCNMLAVTQRVTQERNVEYFL